MKPIYYEWCYRKAGLYPPGGEGNPEVLVSCGNEWIAFTERLGNQWRLKLYVDSRKCRAPPVIRRFQIG